MRQSGKILYTYMFMVYIIPFIFNYFLDTKPIFRTPLDSTYAIIIFTLTIIVLFIFINLFNRLPVIGKNKNSRLKPISYNFLFFYLFGFFIVNCATYYFDLVQWRYQPGLHISENPIIALIAFFQYTFPFILIWIIITDQEFLLSKKPFILILKALLLINVIGGINGFGSALFALLTVLLIIFPKIILSLIFSKFIKFSFKKIIIYLLLISPIIFLIILPLSNLAFVSKSGKNIDYESQVADHATLDYLINRHSVHMSQTLSAIDDGPNIENLMIIKNSFKYRLNVLLGKPFDIVKPEISSYSRQALVQFVEVKLHPTGGSSPGVLASYFMTFPLLSLYPLLIFHFLIIIMFMNYLLYSQPQFSLIGCFVLSYFFLGIPLSSPFDIFTPGPQMIILITIIFMSLRREKKCQFKK